ncbi:MAG TPA: DUF2079 domain-containing protein [Candidatus Baltobacteraceae bacterium]|nr:DUF2079 domain-containing protein [Candidatus Baltobacteraceae bacterium]
MSERSARTGLVVILLVLAASLVTIVHWRFAIFRNDVDLGIFTQVIASVGHGFSSTPEGGIDHLLVHWSPIVALGWPIVRLFGPEGLEWFQAILVSSTLIPLWGLARARFSPGIALAVMGVCALYPLLWANAVGDFHEMAFVPLLSATLVYSLDRRRWRLGATAAVLLACTKEDQFVVLAGIGAICALMWREDAHVRRFGVFLIALGVVGAAAYFGIVRNAIAPHVPYAAAHFFDWNGTSLTPATLAALLARRLDYVLIVLAPLAFLPCISRYGLFLIPGAVEILATHQPVATIPGAHYSALLTGYALASFVDGSSRLAPVARQIGAFAVAAAISLFVAIFASPMEYWYYLYRLPNAHDAQLERTLARLPPDADVGSEDEIFAHLSFDPNASITVDSHEWFLYDETHYSDRWRLVDEPLVRRLVARRVYAIASDRDGIVVLHRVTPSL